ncbi:MAG: hypothetical protein D4R39_02885 [Methylophilaceae bacterium]|nr:MAG: hypothetical protein D4R39_02885 [Methylophilaceae bacterium]
MNKLLATLLAGAFALSLGSVAFAADAAKPVEAAKAPAVTATKEVKAEVAKPVEEAKVAPVKAKKHVAKAKKETAKKVEMVEPATK